MAEWLFWIAVFLIGYSYVIYPLLLAVVSRLMPSPGADEVAATTGDVKERPAVACIIAAFNEEHVIKARIENALAQTYDPAKLTIYVASDGSRDRTGELISAYDNDRVRPFVFSMNRGKATVLNDLVAASSEPILVFSDANTMFAPDAVARLVQRFDDPKVGAVCGELILLDAAGSNQDSAYWRMERFLKRCEAKIGGLLGANGAIYALRRHLYRPIASDTIIDDFCIAMTAAAEGWKLAYDANAIATEDTPGDIADEYRRRVRIGIGNYQALFRHPEYVLNTNWPTRIAYVSHKVLRWLTPHLMIAALLASAVLATGSTMYLGLFLAQLAAYAGAVTVWKLGWERRLPKLGAIVFLFLTLNWAFLVAFAKYVTGRYSGSWRATARTAGSPGSTTL